MRVIFLDIDGVLNSEESVDRAIEHAQAEGKERPSMDDINCDHELLKKFVSFVHKNVIKLVISSSWRSYNLIDTLRYFNTSPFRALIPYIIGVTPRLDSRIRGEEVQWWLDKYENQTLTKDYLSVPYGAPIKYVIVDDDIDMLPHQNFIHVDNIVGLTDKNFEEIISFL